MDQKIQKDWADVMQQFELPVDEINSKDDIKGLNITTPLASKKPRSKAMLIASVFGGTLAIAVATLYSKTENDISLAVLNNLLESTTAISSVKTDTQALKPQYLTLTKDLSFSTLETLAADTSTDIVAVEDQQWKTHIVSSKDKLNTMLSKLGIDKSTSEDLLKVSNISKELNKATEGYILRAEKQDNKLNQLVIYKINSKKSYIITRNDDKYTGGFENKVIETRQTRSTLFIDHSLRYDANQASIPSKIVQKVINIFDRDLKLTRDLTKGDRVTLVYEQIYHQGNKIADGEVLAAELMHNSRSHRAIRFVQADNTVDYFDNKGYDLSNAFKRHPMNAGTFKRISSGFGKRRHPIYKRIRMHTGVDYAANRGSPVTVTGNGIVQHISRKGGYGKTIIIKHNDGYSTLYGHLSRYKKDLKKGQKVYLGDVIGYVGSTGASTGNHLHYEVRVNGIPKNPLKIKLPKGLSLDLAERKKFKEDSRNLVRQLDVLQRFANEKVDIQSGFGG